MKTSVMMGALALAMGAGLAVAQDGKSEQKPASKDAPVIATANPARDNLVRLQKVITLDVTESKLEDVFAYISKETGAQFEPLWKDASGEGMDKEFLDTITAKDLDALTILEKVLDQVAVAGGSEQYTWQFMPYGAVQLGSKKMLNKFKRLETYDMNDLLLEVPVYADVPEVDLEQALQGGGGGGGRSPFSGGGNRDERRAEEREEDRRRRIEVIKTLITQLAEKDAWALNGGDADIEIYEGNFIVNGPDYVHRALAGYTWWPSKTIGTRNRRLVTLNASASNAQVERLENVGTPAVAPGRGR